MNDLSKIAMEETFQNEPLDVFKLPQFETISLNKLSDKYINVLHINMLLIYFFVLMLAFAYFFVAEKMTEVPFNFWFIVMGYIFFILVHIYQFFYYKSKRYCMREKDVIYKSGIISETTTIVPFNKMQHIALNQGWISRVFKLANLQFFTAGGSSIDLSIPGLTFQEAERYRAYALSFISQQEIAEKTIADDQIADKKDESDL